MATNESRYLNSSGFALGNFEIYRKFGSGSSLNDIVLERTTVHISDHTGRIAMVELRNTDYDADDADDVLTRYVYSNHLQSATLELDDEGEIISYEEYHPYGTTAYQAKNDNINALAKRYRYTGKERDEESGLYYHGARYYIPWLARWCSVDPLESKYAGWSPYHYVKCNPVMDTDSTGMGGDSDLKTFTVKDQYYTGYAPTGEQLLVPKGYQVMTTHLEGSALDYVVALKSDKGEVYKWNEKTEWLTTDKGKDYSNPGFLGWSFDVTNWVEGSVKGSIGQLAKDAIEKGDPFLSLKQAYTPFVAYGANGPSMFVTYTIGSGVTKTVQDIKAGGHKRTQALIGVWQFSAQLASGSLLAETKGSGGFLFRGTTEGYQGNSSLLRAGVTPTSPNPAKALVHAIAAEKKWGNGILHIADVAKDLKGVVRAAGNTLAEAEDEFVVSMLPEQFAQKASITITTNQARKILKEMGIDVPLNITPENLTDVAKSMPTMTTKQITEFVKKAGRLK